MYKFLLNLAHRAVGAILFPVPRAPAPRPDTEFPPFFPDTPATRHGVVLVQVATWLLALYGVLCRSHLFPVAVGYVKIGWVSLASVGLCLLLSGWWKAASARIAFRFSGNR